MRSKDVDYQGPTQQEMGIAITLAPGLKGILQVGSSRWSGENRAARRSHKDNLPGIGNPTYRFLVKGRVDTPDARYANVPRHSHRRG